MDIFDWLWANLPFREFLNPDKRIYWLYMLLCLVYALIYIIFSRKNLQNKYFLTWFSKSARIDYAIWIFNYFLQMTVLPLIFMNGIYFAGRVHFFLTEMFGICKIKMFMTSWGIVWYSLVFLIITDFSRFFLHYLLHHNKFLAPFHRLHHSAEVLTPITLYRSHPVEMLLSHVRYLIVYSSVTGVFLYLFNDFYDFPEILGASFFVFISNILGANLRHSNIPIGFGWMEKIFISPKMHQMHHSKDFALQSSNLGALLSVWDRLFSTWKPSKNIEKIEYGIAGQTEQSFFKELYYPFEKWYYLLKSQFSKKRQQN